MRNAEVISGDQNTGILQVLAVHHRQPADHVLRHVRIPAQSEDGAVRHTLCRLRVGPLEGAQRVLWMNWPLPTADDVGAPPVPLAFRAPGLPLPFSVLITFPHEARKRDRTRGAGIAGVRSRRRCARRRRRACNLASSKGGVGGRVVPRDAAGPDARVGERTKARRGRRVCSTCLLIVTGLHAHVRLIDPSLDVGHLDLA